LMSRLPESLRECPDALELDEFCDKKNYNIVHLIYRTKSYEGDSKDYDFSRLSMRDHWRAGYYDTNKTLRHREIFDSPASADGVATFDFATEGSE